MKKIPIYLFDFGLDPNQHTLRIDLYYIGVRIYERQFDLIHRFVHDIIIENKQKKMIFYNIRNNHKLQQEFI